MRLLISFLAVAASAQVQRVTCPVIADSWVDAPPFSRGGNSAATQNHGADPQLVINGRNTFALIQFDLSALRGVKVTRATLRAHQPADQIPITMVGLSTISGAAAWNERSSNYYFAQADTQPWAYAGSDLTDVTFGLGGSLYAYRPARAAADGWFEIEVPPALLEALVTGDQFGWMLSDEKGQTRTRHTLSSREGPHPPELIVETAPAGPTAPGRARSLKTGQQSTIAEARKLGRTTLAPGSAILHFGGAGAGTARYDLRYSRQRITPANFDNATAAPRWSIDPLAPKPSPMAVENSLGDEVHAIVENLVPGAIYYFAARAVGASGHPGPVSPLGAYRAFSRTWPKLPDLSAGAIAGAGSAGDARIWAVADLLKINPKTGELLEKSEGRDYRRHNRIWNAATSTVRLSGARNEFVAFQLAIESPTTLRAIQVTADLRFGNASLPAIFRQTGAVQCYREWFVPDEKDTSANRPYYADPLLPLTGPIDLPAADNAVPGQTVQPIFVDVYIPHDAAPGVHQGSVHVRADGLDQTVHLEIEVLPLRLPDKLNFIVDLNAYGGVNNGYDMPRGTPEYRKLLHAYHRAAHLNRANLDIVGYSHSGSIEPDQAPPLEGEGAQTKVKSWQDWDAHFGPLLDGSAFADLPRAGVPVPIIYLALFENWPGDLRKNYRHNNYPASKTTEEYRALIAKHGLEAGPIEESFPQDFQDRFTAVTAQFAEHFRRNNWLRTQYQVFFNDKYFYKDPALSAGARGVSWWLFDEPNHRDDYRAISFFGWLAKRGLAKYPEVPIIFRADISYVDYIRDLLAGQLDLDCTSQHFFTKNRYLMDNRNRFGKVYWNYATTNHPRESNVAMRAWCWKAWLGGADGIVPWNTVRGMEAWNKAEPLTVFYVGKKFGKNEPFDCLRLKAFRRGEQDVEYATLLANKPGWDREAVSKAAGTPDDAALDQLRQRIAAAFK